LKLVPQRKKEGEKKEREIERDKIGEKEAQVAP
jgi:hypothetical protein